MPAPAGAAIAISHSLVSHPRRGLAAACLTLGACLLTAAGAHADRAFSPRYAATEHGQVTLVANTVETCPGNSSSCRSARDGTTATDNGLLPMAYVDVDSDSGTFDSSQANLALPAGTTVLWAGLYWAGDTSAGSFGSAAPTPGSRAQVRFATPTASYATVTASVLDTDATSTTRYQGFADVTSLVRSAGNGTYAVANVQSGTGGNRWGGWSLVVAYRDTSQPVRRLQVYDGFQALQSGGATSADIAVTDLLTPASGTVRGRLGLLSWEGDRGSTGESATLGTRTLTDALNPVNDVFNSTIGRDGATVTTRNPSYVNTLGFDADELSIDGALANGASSTTLHLTAAGDTYLPGALAVATDEGPPIARVAPAVGGTARDGQTLTADRGTWDGTPTVTYAYQWRRCATDGTGCADMPGATSASYALAPADVGSTVRVVVTATNAAGSTSATSAQTAAVGPTLPVNTGAPSIAGSARDGQTLTADRGTWSGTPTIAYAYQWRRCPADGTGCADIAGATAATYALTPADVGATIRAVVTASNAAGSSSAATTQTAAVAAAAPANTATPTVAGSARDGQTLTADRGTWTGTPTIAYTYQWRRCAADGTGCADIAGATAATLTLTPADVGATIRAVVTASNAAGSAAATSAALGPATATAPVSTSAPSIAGTARDGQTLTVDRGTWTGTPTVAYSYQWRRCAADGTTCTDIAGATGTSYSLTASDVGARLRVAVTAANGGGSTSATAAPTAIVAAMAPINTVAPSIGGTARDGQALTVDRGTWTGTPTIAYTYQWRRCAADGAGCTDIAGATAATYSLSAADVGASLRVAVAASNAAGSTVATTTQTAAVTPVAPANSAAPTTAGTTRDGQTLTAARGTWGGTPTITYAYQWRRCAADGTTCTDVAGATGVTYALTSAEVSSAVRVRVTATNAAGSTGATSAASAVVTPAPPVNTALPAVTGTARDDATVTADRGTWTGTPTIAYDYQWRRCDTDGNACTDIAGATAASYQLTAADVGSTLRVAVTASNAGGGAVATSTATTTVAPAGPANSAAPTIAGTARDAQTLVVDRGTWTGTPTLDYDYQWRRCDADGGGCADIAGATDTTYALTPGDVGATIRVVVAASNAGGSTSAASQATDTVAAAPPASIVAPAISGTARDGATLIANRGTWDGTPTITYAYQWRRCAADGTGCADIAGAAGSTYAPSGADIGHALRVDVTAANAAGDAMAASAATAAVTAAAPANGAAPTVFGGARDGATLGVSDDGTWSGTQPIAFARQWLRCDAGGGGCVAVRGATASAYALTPADVGATFRVRVTATNAGGTTSADSAATAVVTPAPPANTIAPSIDGTARQGDTATADAGSWSGTPTISYAFQWLRCDLTGAGCVDIAGATATTYTPTVDDVGGRVRVRVTATNAGGTASATSAPASVDPAAPAATTAPSVSGTPRDGSTLTANDGSWNGTPPLTFSHQWLRCDASAASCAPIAGATAATYTATPDDVGRTVRVVVSASNAAGSADATSGATATVAAVSPANTAAPSISGTAREGATLTADRGTWSGTPPLSYTYQWRRCNATGGACTPIGGASQPTYRATPADVGKTLRVAVSAVNAAGSSLGVVSAPSARVDPAPPASAVAPSIAGTARDGATLTADRGAWSGTVPIAYTYGWQRCDANGTACADMAGATGASYGLTSADVGGTVRVRVTATNAAGSAVATSSPTAVVAPDAPIDTIAPSVDGTIRDGETLTAQAGEWTGTPPLDYGYQWRRCDADGAGCIDVPGAIGSTYALSPADVGHTVRVVVTATNAAGATAAPSTATTAVDPAAPASTAAPTVAGSARDGATMTAAPGGWTGTPPLDYGYRWQRCDADGTSCADIGGATRADYTLTGDEVGHAVRVVVTATNAAASASAASVASGPIDPAPPVSTSAPSVSGTARDGATLTADRGTWSGTTPISYRYQWQRCDADAGACTDIPGASGSTRRLTSADAGGTVRVQVTATNAGCSATATAPVTAVVVAVAPAATTPPSVSGTGRDGATLSADRGAWSGTTPIDYAYQWQRCEPDGTSCADVDGATQSTYGLVASDVGNAIRVRVTAVNVAGSAVAASAPTAAVGAAPPAATGAPTISGERVDGATLTADAGTWTGTPPLSFAYRWQRCTSDGECTDIDGATGADYTLAADDVGRGVRVMVTASNGGGSATRASDPTSDVDPSAPFATAPPSIAGEPVDGATLEADHGTWTGTPPLAYAYRWQRCERDGTNCADIDGATDRDYAVSGTDVDRALRVVVTAGNAGGSATSASPPTDPVAAAPPVVARPPAVTGSARDGATLTADHGTWDGTAPVDYAYQWQRCDADGTGCADIDGATDRDYAVSGADVDRALRVVVTAGNAGGSATSASPPTDPVASAPPAATTPPAVSGSPRDGATLTADRGTWAGTEPISYAYRWQRCATDGTDCSDITAATEVTYAVTSGDIDHALRVQITASNAAGSASERSAPTARVAAVAPSNGEPPSISGAARDGETLTAHEGTWSGTEPIAYSYQWRRCAGDGTDCIDVDGATNRTYGLVPDDVGHALRVEVRATNAATTATATSDPTLAVAALAPSMRTAPFVVGTVRDGSTLTASRGTWGGTPPFTYAYQWRRCDPAGTTCAGIPGATAPTYGPTADDVNHTIRVIVTASNAGGSQQATSAATGTVLARPPANTAAPTVTGTARDGATLTADPGSWSATPPLDYAYRWQRCDAEGAGCTDIAGETRPTYTLASDDALARVRVAVTATNAAGSATAASGPTDPVAANRPENTDPPTISGTPRDGEQLTADNGTWTGTTPIAYSYRWLRCASDGSTCDDIAEATDSAYRLSSVDAGHAIRVAVSATNVAGTLRVESGPTAPVAAIAPVSDQAPSIEGTARIGQTLAAVHGAWTGSAPIDYAYQWLRCAADGSGCSDVPDATDERYELDDDDIDHALRVRVTATNAAGSASALSVATGRVTAAPAVLTEPTLSGAARDGSTLSADHGTWTGANPIDYAYRWQRCDAHGTGCVDIPAATQDSYLLTAADVGYAIRVAVSASNAGGTREATSATTALVQAATAPATPVPPSGTGTAPTGTNATPAPTPATGAGGVTTDLAGLPGSLVADRACQQLVAGAGARRAQVPGLGAVTVRVRADAVVAPDKPVRVTIAPPRGARLLAALTVDRRRVRVTGRNPLVATIAPAALRGAGTHVLQLRLAAPGAKARTVTTRLRSASCATRFTARGRAVATGSALALRLDSRAALARVAFTMPRTVALRGGAAPRAAGRVRYVVAGGRSRTLRLTLPARRRAGVLLSASGGPRVTFSARGLVVSDLPDGTGIVELTLSEPSRAATRALRLRARVTSAGGSTTLVVRTPATR